MSIAPVVRAGAGAACLALALTGCAASVDLPTPGASAGSAEIVVDNTADVFDEMTLWLVPQYGLRQRLGTVLRNERRVFVVKKLSRVPDYRLVADPVGSDMTSKSFRMGPGDRVEWDMSVNAVDHMGRVAAAR